MSLVAPLLGHFDSGEISPLMMGRVDSERYKSALGKCYNWIPTLQGPIHRRPGTQYVGAVKDSTKKVRLIPFVFSNTQAYTLEFGDAYIRIWTNYGLLLDGAGNPVEVSTQYAFADLPLLRFAQSADTLYLTHPNYAPAKLQRFSATIWKWSYIVFQDGPYQAINGTQMTMTPSATSGTGVTITAGPVQTVTAMSVTTAVGGIAGNNFATLTIAGHGWSAPFPLALTATNLAQPQYFPTSLVQIVDSNTIKVGPHSAIASAWTTPASTTPAPFPAGGLATQFPVRLEHGTTWGWGLFQSNLTSTQAINGAIDTNLPFGATTATKTWRTGLWYYETTQTGTANYYPACVGFHEDRLCFSGTPTAPQRIDLSMTSQYEFFSPTTSSGTVVDSHACNFSLNSSDCNYNEWISTDEKGLLAGSTAAEWLLRPSVNSEAITPTNVNAKRSTKWGSAAISAIQIGKATLHVQRGARKLRELVYSFYIDGYQSTDLTELSEHITGSGVTELCYTAIPFPIVWLLRNDGALIGMTYDRDFQQLRIGWHSHQLGGQSDGAGSPAIIESITVIPSPDGTRDDLWMVVNRWIGGATVRTVEYLKKVFEDIDLQQNAFFVDCGLTYDNPLTLASVTKANPGVFTVTAHGLSTGNTIRIDAAVGMPALNGNRYTVTVIDVNTFSLTDLHGVAVDTTSFPTYISGGQVRKLVTTISGLTYLNGETVSIYADGCVQPSQVVSGGAITLQTPAAVVSVGYDYNSDGEILRLEAGARNGTSIGKERRIHRVGMMVHRGQGLQVGKDFNSLDLIDMRTQGVDPNGAASALFTGIQSVPTEFDSDFDNQLCFRVSSPQPCTILAIMPQLEEQDRA